MLHSERRLYCVKFCTGVFMCGHIAAGRRVEVVQPELSGKEGARALQGLLRDRHNSSDRKHSTATHDDANNRARI